MKKTIALFVLAGVTAAGLCAEPDESMSLASWAAVMLATKGAAFLAAYGMYRILNNATKP